VNALAVAAKKFAVYEHRNTIWMEVPKRGRRQRCAHGLEHWLAPSNRDFLLLLQNPMPDRLENELYETVPSGPKLEYDLIQTEIGWSIRWRPCGRGPWTYLTTGPGQLGKWKLFSTAAGAINAANAAAQNKK
jgi:hypothetical protein